MADEQKTGQERLNEVMVDHELITRDMTEKIEAAESEVNSPKEGAVPIPSESTPTSVNDATLEIPEQLSESLSWQEDTLSDAYAHDPNVTDALQRYPDSEPVTNEDLQPLFRIPPPVPPEAPVTIDPEAGDPLVNYYDLDDAKPWAGGETDQAPDDIREGQGLVETAYQYHTKLNDVLSTMQEFLLTGISDLEALMDRFQRMR